MAQRWLRPNEVEKILDEITDEQGENSECGGDSDADDEQPSPIQTSSSSNSGAPDDSGKAKRPKRNVNTVPDYGFSSSDEDLDDSVEDSDCGSERLPVNHLRVVPSDSENSSDDTDDEVSVPNGPHDGPNWSKTPSDPGTFSTFYFSEPPHGAKDSVNFDSPWNVVQTFLTVTFLSSIVDQSNLFAMQKGVQLNMTLDELKAMIGILIIMGFHCLPSMRLYWSNDENFHVSRISRIMPLKRFLELLRFLHLNDNSKMLPRDSPNFDRLFKLRPMIIHLQNLFPLVFRPSRFMSIGESMVGFKGRTSLKQYMPMKPIKRGYKVWVMACAVTGFVMAFDVYTGKSAEQTGMGVGEKVVFQLSSMLRGLGFILFFDKFFSSYTLIKRLLSERLFACGTFRSNRKCYPKDQMKQDKLMKTGDVDFVQDGDISVVKWRDRGKKSVVVISSCHNPSKLQTVLRTKPDGTRVEVRCPDAIAEYNAHMGGVDKFDQLMSAYSISQKSRRWWVKLFYYFVDMSIVNSYIMYADASRKARRRKMSYLQFRSKLANEIVGTFVSRRRHVFSPVQGRGRKRNKPDGFPTVQNTVRLVNVGEHMPVVGNKYRRCAHCSTKQKEKRSNMICTVCDVALCKACFTVFHKT